MTRSVIISWDESGGVRRCSKYSGLGRAGLDRVRTFSNITGRIGSGRPVIILDFLLILSTAKSSACFFPTRVRFDVGL